MAETQAALANDQLLLEKELEKKERKLTFWRFLIVGLVIFFVAGVIYYLFLGADWVYHKIFGPQTTQIAYQTPLGTGNAEPVTNRSQPVVSDLNVIAVPQQQVAVTPNGGVSAGGGGAAAPSGNSLGSAAQGGAAQLPPGQIQNNPGCPDYLGDSFACVQ